MQPSLSHASMQAGSDLVSVSRACATDMRIEERLNEKPRMGPEKRCNRPAGWILGIDPLCLAAAGGHTLKPIAKITHHNVDRDQIACLSNRLDNVVACVCVSLRCRSLRQPHCQPGHRCRSA